MDLRILYRMTKYYFNNKNAKILLTFTYSEYYEKWDYTFIGKNLIKLDYYLPPGNKGYIIYEDKP